MHVLKFKSEVENQLDKKIKKFRYDTGGEYSTKTLEDFCEKNGIIHEVSASYTPQQNGYPHGKIEPLKK